MDKLKKKISVVKREHHFFHGNSDGEHEHKNDISTNGAALHAEHNTLVTQYLGFVEIKSPGLDEICENVDKMYTQAKPFMKTLEKTTLKIVQDGIEIGPRAEETNDEDHSKLYKFRRILYCGVDKQHRRVFSFNYQYGSRAENIHLHVIVCKTKEDAKYLAKKLGDIFKDISVEMHRKEKEDKRRHSENLSKSRGSSQSEPNVSRCRIAKTESNCSEAEVGSPQSFGSDGLWECGVMSRRSPVSRSSTPCHRVSSQSNNSDKVNGEKSTGPEKYVLELPQK